MANLPKTGITTSMVGNALGTTSRDVGTLCKHSSINKWAKYKPIVYNTTSPLTEAQRKEKNYGITAWSGSSPNQVIIMYLMVDGGNTITYNSPTGGTAAPYRLGDFRKYNHAATAPVTNFFRSNTNIPVTNDFQEISPIEGIGADETILTKQEVYYCTNQDGEVEPLNYCVAIKTGTTSTETPLWSVGGIPWNNPSWNKYKGKKCHVYEFFTNVPEGKNSSNWIANTTDKFFLLPEAYHTVTFKQSSTGSTSYEFKIGARFETKGNTSVTGTVTVSSVDTTSKVYTGGTITMMRAELLTSSTATSHVGYTYLVMDGGNQVIGTEQSRQFVCTLSPTNSSVTLSSCKVKLYWKTVANPTVQSQIYSIMIGVGDLEIIT